MNKFQLLRAVQTNTNRVHAGFWSVTAPASHKTVANIVKTTSGKFGVTSDMTEHSSFMAAVAHIAEVFADTFKPVKKLAAVFALVVAAVMSAATPAHAADLKFPASVQCANLINGNGVNITIDKTGHASMTLFISGAGAQTQRLQKPFKKKGDVYGSVTHHGNDTLLVKITPHEDNTAHADVILTSACVTSGDHHSDDCQIVNGNTDNDAKDFE